MRVLREIGAGVIRVWICSHALSARLLCADPCRKELYRQMLAPECGVTGTCIQRCPFDTDKPEPFLSKRFSRSAYRYAALLGPVPEEKYWTSTLYEFRAAVDNRRVLPDAPGSSARPRTQSKRPSRLNIGILEKLLPCWSSNAL